MDLEILGRVGAGVSKLLCGDGDGAPRLTVTSATNISVRNIFQILCSSRLRMLMLYCT